MRCSERVRLAWVALSAAALLGGLLSVPAGANAEEAAGTGPDIDAALRDIQQQAGTIAEEVQGEPMADWLGAAEGRADAFVEEAQSIAEHADATINREHCEEACAMPDEHTCRIGSTDTAERAVTFLFFASRSLGDGQLRELFALAAGAPDTRIVFRGVGADESLIAFIASLKPLLRDLDPPPTVLLDPTPFREHGITAVPTLVAIGPDGRELARVAGLASTRWLREALAEGKRGDLGTRGPMSEIAESDLLETIHRRLASIDFRALGEQAVARAFDNLRFEHLPAAGEDRARLIDPTIIAAADIRLPDGTLLVAAGDSVNPLDRLPFTQRLVVFDAADARQLAFVQALASKPSERRTTVLIAGLSRRDGWAALTRVIEQLDQRVYLLTPELRQRFALERVPAVVEAVGRRFRVTEHAMVGQVTAEHAP
jgi:conjugal transfer pilus assembly protein TraW